MQHSQQEIADALGVNPEFDVAMEVRRRLEFLAQYLSRSNCRTYVLGISGGVDSLAAGLLAQAAVSQLRAAGKAAQFIAVRLPYGLQADEADAQHALDVIKPDRTVTVDIKFAADDMMRAVTDQANDLFDPMRKDFHLGNIKARQRMIAQYALAGASQGLVIGTDQAAEALMGFFTKFGDGAADVLPLLGLTKRRVRSVAAHMGAPDNLVFKVPTADLETDAPLRPDEEVYGVSYDEIDDFLEGRPIGEATKALIVRAYEASAHKRSLPVGPSIHCKTGS